MTAPLPFRPSRRPPDDRAPLRLPTVGDDAPAGGIVRRAVSATLVVIAMLVAVAVAVASLVHIDRTVDADGLLEPAMIHPVRAQEAGVVREVLVRGGQSVTAGQPLVHLDSLQLVATLAQLRAQYASASVDRARAAATAPVQEEQRSEAVSQADTRIVRARAVLRERLIEFGFGSDVDSVLRTYVAGRHTGIDMAVSDIRAAETDRRVARAQLALGSADSLGLEKERVDLSAIEAQMAPLRERVRRLTIVSPAAGVILTEQPDLLIGAAVREGDVLMEVAPLESWRVQLFIDPRDVHRIHVGDAVKVDVQPLSALNQPLLRGRVVTIGEQPAASASGAASTTALSSDPRYRVIVELDKGTVTRTGIDRLRRGYLVRGKIIGRSGRIIVLLWQTLMEHVHRP